MAREIIHLLTDFDQPAEKRRIVTSIAILRGHYEVTIEPRRNTRSYRQNRWYWVAIVEPFSQFLAHQDYEQCSKDFAHQILAAKFLTVDIADPVTGQVIASRVRSTTELDTAQFAHYCERCRHWLWEFFNVPTDDPALTRVFEEPEPRRVRAVHARVIPQKQLTHQECQGGSDADDFDF